MLSHLSIRDIVLIDRLDLEFAPGLSVLTGETGAGKSILLDALSLALGARGDASRVRSGQSQGQITAVFDVTLDHPVRSKLLENGIEAEGDVILRRIQSADGRARVFVNDQPASVSLMREIGGLLVELHGQHDDRALVDPSSHRQILDMFGGHEKMVGQVAECYRAWRNCEGELARHRAEMDVATRDRDYLTDSLLELQKIKPKAGEEEALALRRADMMNVEKTASDIRDAEDIIAGPNSAIPVLAALQRRLARKASEAPEMIDPILNALEEALNGLDQVQVAVEVAMRMADFDPAEQERIEERLFGLRGLARKHNCLPDALPELMANIENRLDALDAGDDRLGALVAEAKARREAFDKEAGNLSLARGKVASALVDAVHAELPGLKLGQAEFIVDMQTDADRRNADGIDVIEFWVRTNPGTRAGPMMKVASGGELSRFLLALKVALAERGSAPTLIFDEIDTGVGGAVADAIGQRLARLSEHVQVISVTHAPQVAARATTHLLIAKATGEDGATRTSVAPLKPDARREEIARMLAGATITDEARQAAARLLDVAV